MDALHIQQLLEKCSILTKNVLFRWAPDVDMNNRFPKESINALKEIGLLGYFVPKQYGGYEGDFHTYWQLAAILAEGCASTALIWVMHCQQVLALADHAHTIYADVLHTLVEKGLLIASVTSESGKGSDFFTARAALSPEGEGFHLKRFAPIVSYGAEATFFLITARASEESSLKDVKLALVTRENGSITVEGEWNSMGMRATQSIPMHFDVHIPLGNIIPVPFRYVALQSMVPVIHLGWAAVWFGAARGALNRFVQQLRFPHVKEKNITSEMFLHRLSRLRVSLDLMEAMLEQTAQRLDKYRQNTEPFSTYENLTHTIGLNNLKVATSELAFSLMNDLVSLGGMQRGYLQNDPCGIERTFRDLRSAALMYNNDRLLETNGRLIIMEYTPIHTIWEKGTFDH